MSAPLAPLIYSKRVRSALQWGESAHRGVSRKSGDHPYLLHLVAVAQLLAAAGADDDLLCAGYLHDSVEDTGVSLTQIADRFGSRVANLVAGVTKVDSLDGKPLSRVEKNDLVCRIMAEADIDVVALKAADLTANISDLIFDQDSHGYAHWEEIFRDPDVKIAHYLRLADILLDRLAASGRYPLLHAALLDRSQQMHSLYQSWAR